MVKITREKTDAGPWLSAVESTGGGGGTPGGADTQVQYNDGGSFGGAAGFTFNDANGAVTVNPAGDTNALSVLVDNVASGQMFRIRNTADGNLFGVDSFGTVSWFPIAAGHAIQQLYNANGNDIVFEVAADGVFTVSPGASETFKVDEDEIGFFGHATATQPEVPAIPTPQDVVDALVALGLVTQAP